VGFVTASISEDVIFTAHLPDSVIEGVALQYPSPSDYKAIIDALLVEARELVRHGFPLADIDPDRSPRARIKPRVTDAEAAAEDLAQEAFTQWWALGPSQMRQMMKWLLWHQSRQSDPLDSRPASLDDPRSGA
jgi:hypothetical protein